MELVDIFLRWVEESLEPLFQRYPLLKPVLAAVVVGLGCVWWLWKRHAKDSNLSARYEGPAIITSDLKPGGNVNIASGDIIIIPSQPPQGIFGESSKDLSRQLGLTEGLIISFLAQFDEQHIPREQWAGRLAEIAKNYKEFQEKLKHLETDAPQTRSLVEQARALADEGRFDEAERLLTQAEERGFAVAIQAREAKAALAATRLQYDRAARLLLEAAEWVKGRDEERYFSLLNEAANHLFRHGELTGDRQALHNAIRLYEELLSLRPREKAPLDWAGVQNNLGNALARIGGLLGNREYLQEAIGRYQLALSVQHRREVAPDDWAMTQNNLGNTLRRLHELTGENDLLKKAIEAFKCALEVWRRDVAALNWAMVQNNLGATLARLGESTGEIRYLKQAVESFLEALKERTRDRFPYKWANTQANLAYALEVIGEFTRERSYLEEARERVLLALEVLQRDVVPLGWAQAQNILGTVLCLLGEFTGNHNYYLEAERSFEKAVEIFRELEATAYLQMAEANLRLCRQELARG